MTYRNFLERLRETGWDVPNKSLAYRVFGGAWQVSFVRLGGKFQRPGQVAFVICVRHMSMRNVEGERRAVEKDPFSYPFRLTMQQIERGDLRYAPSLLNYEYSELGAESDWSPVQRAVEVSLPKWLATRTPQHLHQEIADLGENAYIEKLWLDDLASA